MRTTNIRFTGLASGLDTESMVKALTMPYQNKVDSAKGNQTMMEWKKDAWRNMNKRLFDFYDQQLSKLRLESTYNKYNVSVSNTSAIEVKPGSTLPEGTHSIDYIKELAQSAKVTTNKLQTADANSKVTAKTKLSELVDDKGNPIFKKNAEGKYDPIKIKVSDSVDSAGNPIYKEIELSADMSIADMQGKFKSAMPNTNVTFDESAGAFFISGKKTGESQFIKITADNEDARNTALSLLGVASGGTVGKETITGSIQYETTIKAPGSTKLSEVGLDKATLANGDKLRIPIEVKVGEATVTEMVEVTLTEDMTLDGLSKKVNEAIGKNNNLKDKKISFAYDSTKGEFKLEENGTAKDLTNMKIVKVEGETVTDNETALNKLKPVDGLTTKAVKPATGTTTLEELGFFAGGETEKIFTVTIDGKNIPVTVKRGTDTEKGTTLKDFADQLQQQINTATGTGGKYVFKFDERNSKFVVGEGIEVQGTPEELKTLGIQKSQEVYTASGSNAVLSYNGVEIESESNNVSVNGFNFTIKSTVGKWDDKGVLVEKNPITVVSTFDADAVVDVVKNFVDEYNKLITEIHGKLDAPSSKGYTPLTEAQKKEMSEYEIEQWEKKIKDSLFRGDKDLEKTVSDMRKLLGETVAGNAFGSLSAIGISTGDWKENGKLHFDEDKFRKALSEDSDAVTQLLAGSGDPATVFLEENPGKTMADFDDKQKAIYEKKTKGFMDRMYDHITDMTKSSELKTAYSFYNDKQLTKNITSQKDEVRSLENRMLRMEDLYYKKFTAMESMMQSLNNQSNYLMSQLGGM